MADSSNGSVPTYIYKIVPSSSPVPAELPDKLPVSDIDQSSGFVHMSTAKQVPNTLKFFFKDDPKVYVLRVVYEKIDSLVKWEDPEATVCGPRGGEGLFPHIHGNDLTLGKNEIERVEVLERGSDGWDAALEAAAKDWLVY